MTSLGYDCDGSSRPPDPEEELEPLEPLEPLAPLMPKISKWNVNGIQGGSAEYGTVTGLSGHKATYTAPARKPSPDEVKVSAEFISHKGEKIILVSSIKILDNLPKYAGTFDKTSITTNRTLRGNEQTTYTIHAELTWTPFPDSVDGRYFEVSGTATVSINEPKCAPYTATLPVQSSPGVPALSLNVPSDGRYSWHGAYVELGPRSCDGGTTISSTLGIEPCDFSDASKLGYSMGDGRTLTGSTTCNVGSVSNAETRWDFIRK